jgi:hypothetical protein
MKLLCNSSPFQSYGLAGAVISGDRERCQRLAEVCLKWRVLTLFDTPVKLVYANCSWDCFAVGPLPEFISLQLFFHNNCVTAIPTTGDQRRMHLGKLLATLLLPSSLGREQAQWIWTRARRRVSRAWLLYSLRHITVNDFYLTRLCFAGALIITWASSK